MKCVKVTDYVSYILNIYLHIWYNQNFETVKGRYIHICEKFNLYLEKWLSVFIISLLSVVLHI